MLVVDFCGNFLTMQAFSADLNADGKESKYFF